MLIMSSFPQLSNAKNPRKLSSFVAGRPDHLRVIAASRKRGPGTVVHSAGLTGESVSKPPVPAGAYPLQGANASRWAFS